MGVEADENNQIKNPQIKVFFVERLFDFLNFDYFEVNEVEEVNVQYESVLEHLLNVQWQKVVCLSFVLTVEFLTGVEENNIDTKSMAQDVWLRRMALITCVLLSVLAG